MNSIVFLAASFSVCVTAASSAAFLTPLVSSISSQYHAQDALGQYSYGYTNSLSSKSEVRTADGVTRGGYSYIDPEGNLQSIEYSSDSVNGFRAVGTNIPSVPQPTLELHQPVQIADTPEVAEARAKHLAAVEEAKLRAAGYQPFIVSPVAPGVIQHIPGSFSLRTDLIPGTNSLAHFVPAFSYSYGIPEGFLKQRVVASYIAPATLSSRADIPQSADPSGQQHGASEDVLNAVNTKSKSPVAEVPDQPKQSQ